MTVYVLAFALAMSMTVAVTPVVIRMARAANLLDRPGLRKKHMNSVPRLGGAAIALGVVGTIACLAVMRSTVASSVRESSAQWSGFVLGAVAVFIVGLIDDISGVRASRKLLAQLAAAMLVCLLGIRLDTLDFGDHLIIHLGLWGWPVTILWITGMTNALNLIDGLDGLATGIAAMAGLVIAILAACGGQPALAVVMLTVVGALTAFLLFNFHPARVFLGDCGAMTLGFVLASASVKCAADTGRAIDIAMPALALAIPILDTLHCIVRRRMERRSVFSGDRGHIHHRLIDAGLTQQGVAIVLYGITIMASGFGLLMLTATGFSSIVVFVCILLFVVQLLKAIGAMPLRENIAAMQRNRLIAHQAQLDREAFERARLRFEGIHSFDEWWEALSGSAAEMRLSRIVLWLTDPDDRSVQRTWEAATTEEGSQQEHLRTTLLLRIAADAPPALLAVDIPVDGAFELAGCRVQFFARLIDEFSPAKFTDSTVREPSLKKAGIPERVMCGERGSSAVNNPEGQDELVFSGVVGID